MVTVLWLSRHVPQRAQIEELERVFGDVEVDMHSVTLDNDPRAGVDEVERLMDEVHADELVGVLPIAHVAELTRRGIQPIRAIMEREPTGQTLANGEIEYRFTFVNYERIMRVVIESEPL